MASRAGPNLPVCKVLERLGFIRPNFARILLDDVVVGATNSKSLLLFGAILPQITDPCRGAPAAETPTAPCSSLAWGPLRSSERAQASMPGSRCQRVTVVSGGNGNGEHRADVGTFDSLGLQFWWDVRVVNQAEPIIVQVVDLRRDSVALTVALADIGVDLEAHGVLLGVRLGVLEVQPFWPQCSRPLTPGTLTRSRPVTQRLLRQSGCTLVSTRSSLVAGGHGWTGPDSAPQSISAPSARWA